MEVDNFSEKTFPRDQLTPGLVNQLQAVGTTRKYAAGARIHSTGDPADALSIVKSGRVSMWRTGATGEDSMAVVFSSGDCFGLFPLLMDQPRCNNAQAIENSQLIQVGASRVWEMIDDSPDVRRQVIGFLSSRLARVLDMLDDERRLPLAERLAKRMIDCMAPNGLVSLSQSQLAQQMGVSRNTVGTALKKMVALGFVRDRKSVV
jgi:CRP/FNR family transcriptional regulator, cyclic AMP receptor protein